MAQTTFQPPSVIHKLGIVAKIIADLQAARNGCFSERSLGSAVDTSDIRDNKSCCVSAQTESS